MSTVAPETVFMVQGCKATVDTLAKKAEVDVTI